jgi:GntR family transcriptional regulator/MocR family aminotransferase
MTASARPAYRRLYRRLRDEILSGRLAAGARLEPSRQLAARLGLARGTIEVAYQMLAAEGYVSGRGAAGTFVNTVTPVAVRGAARTPERGAGPARVPGAPPMTADEASPLLFRLGLPALDAFPHKLWASALARAARRSAPSSFAYPDAFGLWALRDEIARYLRISRGIACTPDAIAVTAGFQGALDLIGRVLVAPGDPVWIENPGYPFTCGSLAAARARLVSVALDASGLRVDRGIAKAARARLAVVTPTHQFPLGYTMPVARRLELLDWAARAGAWIVEDDYDSEFHYRGLPPPALKSLDAAGRVIYVGTFSKVMNPGLRVGYALIPPRLSDRFRRAAGIARSSPSYLVQDAIAAFMAAGHFVRHLARMRRLYAERRQAFAAALTASAGGRFAIDASPGGMHLVGRLPARRSDRAAVAALRRHGLAAIALSDCGRGAGQGLLLGFTNVAVHQAAVSAERLVAALG